MLRPLEVVTQVAFKKAQVGWGKIVNEHLARLQFSELWKGRENTSLLYSLSQGVFIEHFP